MIAVSATVKSAGHELKRFAITPEYLDLGLRFPTTPAWAKMILIAYLHNFFIVFLTSSIGIFFPVK